MVCPVSYVVAVLAVPLSDSLLPSRVSTSRVRTHLRWRSSAVDSSTHDTADTHTHEGPTTDWVVGSVGTIDWRTKSTGTKGGGRGKGTVTIQYEKEEDKSGTYIQYYTSLPVTEERVGGVVLLLLLWREEYR